ncbi:hypothetical protein N7449_006423 [Penicillium cf. viridicatum]|uniref:Uncharacterized protein n=1 Tax=Penicillium cf. viridicatum TaxID=2972119 RepID=A0A9W9JFB8_9EURO|nr:hypothetical protein N7449_006423 [Penicillium cf. viridicatum]
MPQTAGSYLQPIEPTAKHILIPFGIGSIHQCRKYEDVFAWADRFRYNDDGDAERFSGSKG